MKALFIGLGSIGQRHLMNLKELRKDIELYALRSSDSNYLIKDGKRTVVPSLESHYGFTAIKDLDKALELKPEIVFITNPTALHIDKALAFAKIGSHLLIEKPISHNLDKVDELINICKENKLITLVAYQMRFNPVVNKAKKIIQENFKKIITASFEWNTNFPMHHPYEDYSTSYAAKEDMGGGVILSLSHEHDLISYLIGVPKDLFVAGGSLSSLKMTAEDTIMAIMDYPGFLASLNLSFAQTKEVRKFKIQFTDKTLIVNLIDNDYYYELFNEKGALIERFEPKTIRNELFISELKHFLDSVDKNQQTILDIIEGKKSLEFALNMKKAMKKNEYYRPVQHKG